jgi:hypothetical protein
MRYTQRLYSLYMKTRFLLSTFALLFGFGVLFISLSTGASTVASAGQHSASESEFYFGKVDPDHVFYPVLMAVDRVHLETATNNERIFIEIQYSNDRLESALNLLEKEKQDLAVTTLTKGEKYLHQAVSEAHELDSSQSVQERIKKALEYHSRKLKEIKPQLTDANRATIDMIIKENEILADSLK